MVDRCRRRQLRGLGVNRKLRDPHALAGGGYSLPQHAAKRRVPSPPSDVTEHDAKPQRAREREPMTSTPSPASFQRALVALFVETDGHLAVAGHDQATDEILKSNEGVDVPWEEVWRVMEAAVLNENY